MAVVVGWTAARGKLEAETLILFAIMFVWQFPHFLSIAWLYREDYAQGEIRMFPVVDSDGRSTVWRILAYSAAFIPVSVLPVPIGMAGRRCVDWPPLYRRRPDPVCQWNGDTRPHDTA